MTEFGKTVLDDERIGTKDLFLDRCGNIIGMVRMKLLYHPAEATVKYLAFQKKQILNDLQEIIDREHPETNGVTYQIVARYLAKVEKSDFSNRDQVDALIAEYRKIGGLA